MQFSIQRVTADIVRPLRAEVLRPGEPFERNLYPGDDAPETFHAGAYCDDRLVGSTTAMHQSPPHLTLTTAWRLRGVTTHPTVRGQGFGARLIEFCTEYVRQQGGTYLWFYANPPAVGFYEHLGFERHPDLLNHVLVGPPHPLMWRWLVTPPA